MKSSAWSRSLATWMVASSVACGARSGLNEASGTADTTAGSGTRGGGTPDAAMAGAGPTSTAMLGPASIDPDGKLGPARVGVTAYLSQPADADAMSCPAVGGYQLGAPNAPTASDPGQGVPNGTAGDGQYALINCLVAKQGTFRFSGAVHAALADGDLLELVFERGVIGADFKGTADVSFFVWELHATYESTAPCTITVDNQQIKGGALWANFSCDQVAYPYSGACGLKGTFVFQNCAGS